MDVKQEQWQLDKEVLKDRDTKNNSFKIDFTLIKQWKKLKELVIHQKII